MPVPAVLLNENLDVVDASRPAYELFGIPRLAEPSKESLEYLGKTLLERADLIASLGAASMRLAVPGNRECFVWQNGARRFEVTIAAAQTREKCLHFLACFLDQTGLVELERSSERARSYLESVMSSLHMGITVVNRDLEITNMNAAQEEQLSIMGSAAPLLSLIGRPLAEAFPDEAEVIETLAPDVLEKSAVCGGILERYEFKGVERVFSVGFSPLRDETGGVVGMIRVAEEVTERDKMANDLHQAELRASEVATIQKLMVTLNHELNNSLTAITGNIELMKTVGGDLPPEKNIMLQEIATHTERIVAVTDRLRNAQQAKTKVYLKDGTNMIDTGLPEPGSEAG